jgi:hypothetical protein
MNKGDVFQREPLPSIARAFPEFKCYALWWRFPLGHPMCRPK